MIGTQLKWMLVDEFLLLDFDFGNICDLSRILNLKSNLRPSWVLQSFCGTKIVPVELVWQRLTIHRLCECGGSP